MGCIRSAECLRRARTRQIVHFLEPTRPTPKYAHSLIVYREHRLIRPGCVVISLPEGTGRTGNLHVRCNRIIRFASKFSTRDAR
jgi:hypothetical protein